MLLEHSNENWFTDLFKKKKKDTTEDKVTVVDKDGYLSKEKQHQRVTNAWTKPDDLLDIWKEFLDDGYIENVEGKYARLGDLIKDIESFIEASNFKQHPLSKNYQNKSDYDQVLKDFREKIKEPLYRRTVEDRDKTDAETGGWGSIEKVTKLCGLIKKLYDIHHKYNDWKKSVSEDDIKAIEKTFEHLELYNEPEGLKEFRKVLLALIDDGMATRKSLFGTVVKDAMKHYTKGNESMDEFFKLTYEMEEFIDESRKIDIGLEMYSEICDVIEKCGGVTPALEHMFGENFSSAASMEAEATAEKEAWYKRLWQWIKDFFAKLWAWFKSWFQTRDGMIKKLNELKDKVNAGKIKYPVLVPISINWVTKMAADMEFMRSIKFESVDKWPDALADSIKEKFNGYFENIAAEFASQPKRIPVEDDKTLN